MRTTALLTAARAPEETEARAMPLVRAPLRVEDVYEAHFDFVWRTARRLGVLQPHLDDVVQEVFMVVQRRLNDFEGRSEIRTWLFAITRRTVQSHFRQNSRRPLAFIDEPGELIDPSSRCAESEMLASENSRLLHALLDELDDEKRAVFVLAELEELSGPAIAQALKLDVSTVYARIRTARQAFDMALRRYRARQARMR